MISNPSRTSIFMPDRKEEYGTTAESFLWQSPSFIRDGIISIICASRRTLCLLSSTVLLNIQETKQHVVQSSFIMMAFWILFECTPVLLLAWITVNSVFLADHRYLFSRNVLTVPKCFLIMIVLFMFVSRCLSLLKHPDNWCRLPG